MRAIAPLALVMLATSCHAQFDFTKFTGGFVGGAGAGAGAAGPFDYSKFMGGFMPGKTADAAAKPTGEGAKVQPAAGGAAGGFDYSKFTGGFMPGKTGSAGAGGAFDWSQFMGGAKAGGDATGGFANYMNMGKEFQKKFAKKDEKDVGAEKKVVDEAAVDAPKQLKVTLMQAGKTAENVVEAKVANKPVMGTEKVVEETAKVRAVVEKAAPKATTKVVAKIAKVPKVDEHILIKGNRAGEKH